MKYLKITLVKKDEETNIWKHVVSFLNVNNISEIGIDEKGELHVVGNGESCVSCVDRNQYPVVRLQTNDAAIYRFLKQSGFKIGRRYF